MWPLSGQSRGRGLGGAPLAEVAIRHSRIGRRYPLDDMNVHALLLSGSLATAQPLTVRYAVVGVTSAGYVDKRRTAASTGRAEIGVVTVGAFGSHHSEPALASQMLSNSASALSRMLS